MRFPGTLLLLVCLSPVLCRAGELNLATLSCDKYENEVLTAADSINTVMWLFGYSVAKLGEHVMYGDALTSFGFALDAECKNSPSTSLLQAMTSVRPKRGKPRHRPRQRKHHHDVAVWLLRGSIRQPPVRCGRAGAFRFGAAKPLHAAFG